MPRKEYKTITIKNATYDRFLKTIQAQKRKTPRIHQTEFLELLLDMYHKKSLEPHYREINKILKDKRQTKN
ncbi:MAG: hypothetical protein KGH89_09225 [Thaumarchaeota archaeon]|nr:hypothetical protein [Candidatus Nitrosotalea sp.]MDE1727426.1 hypothetical protein [Nitrososphaerota archaeon]MDE1813229.1 hypothetical protein [Nitrososphaerota archaeon]MDE1838678.1 hypothetical protein [Nitrososphaerota archaeon]